MMPHHIKIISLILVVVKVARSVNFFSINYGGADQQYARDVLQTNSAIFQTGHWQVADGGQTHWDAFFTKFSLDGNVEWTSSFGTAAQDYGLAMTHVSSGGFVVVGNAGDDAFIAKLSENNGALEWAFVAGYTGRTTEAFCVAETSDGNFLVAGEQTSFTSDILVMKYDPQGNMLWANTFGDTNYDGASFVSEKSDGNIRVIGYSSQSGTGEDIVILTLDANGELLSTKFLTTAGNYRDRILTGLQLSDDSVIIAGRTKAGHQGSEDMLVCKLTSGDEFDWCKAIGDAFDDRARAVNLMSDGSFVVGGYIKQEPTIGYRVLLQLSSSGSLLEAASIQHTDPFTEIYSVQHTSDDALLFCGTGYHTDSTKDAYVAKLPSDLAAVTDEFCSGIDDEKSSLTVTPVTLIPIQTTLDLTGQTVNHAIWDSVVSASTDFTFIDETCSFSVEPAITCTYSPGRWRGTLLDSTLQSSPDVCCEDCRNKQGCTHWQHKQNTCVLLASNGKERGGNGWVHGEIPPGSSDLTQLHDSGGQSIVEGNTNGPAPVQ